MNLYYLSGIVLGTSETGWDLGPFAAGLQCLHLDTPLLQQQNTKKLSGTKNNCMPAVRVNSGPKRYKETKKPNCHFWRAWSKSRGWGPRAGYCAHPLHTPPPKGWAKHLSHPSGPTPGHTPTLTPYKEQARPSQGANKQGNLLFVLTAHCCSRGPSKALPEFLVWTLINFYWLRRPRTLVGNARNIEQKIESFTSWGKKDRKIFGPRLTITKGFRLAFYPYLHMKL